MSDDDNLKMKQDDHDLLIELHTIIKQVRTDIKELKDNLADRVSKLEMGKYPSTDFVQFRTSEFVPLVKEVEKLDSKVTRYVIILGITWFLFSVGVVAGWQYFLTRVGTTTNNTTNNTTNK